MKRSSDGPVRRELKAFSPSKCKKEYWIVNWEQMKTGKAWKHLGRKLTNGRTSSIILASDIYLSVMVWEVRCSKKWVLGCLNMPRSQMQSGCEITQPMVHLFCHKSIICQILSQITNIGWFQPTDPCEQSRVCHDFRPRGRSQPGRRARRGVLWEGPVPLGVHHVHLGVESGATQLFRVQHPGDEQVRNLENHYRVTHLVVANLPLTS